MNTETWIYNVSNKKKSRNTSDVNSNAFRYIKSPTII